jgi:hypothetical protein
VSFQEDFDASLREVLSPLGFELAGSHRWVSPSRNSIRRLVHFELLKGGVYTPRWGFSVDFVPVLRSRRLRWKRTLKSAAFDLCIDPVDELGVAPHWGMLLQPIEGYRRPTARHVAAAASATAQRAHRDFLRVDGVADLAVLFAERSLMRFERFSLDNYVQTEIAWGLCLLAMGRPDEGGDRIARFCDRFDVSVEDTLLAKARIEATAALI